MSDAGIFIPLGTSCHAAFFAYGNIYESPNIGCDSNTASAPPSIVAIATALTPGVILLVEPIDFHSFPPSLVMYTSFSVAVAMFSGFSGSKAKSLRIGTCSVSVTVFPSYFLIMSGAMPLLRNSKSARFSLYTIPFDVRKYQRSPKFSPASMRTICSTFPSVHKGIAVFDDVILYKPLSEPARNAASRPESAEDGSS